MNALHTVTDVLCNFSCLSYGVRCLLLNEYDDDDDDDDDNAMPRIKSPDSWQQLSTVNCQLSAVSCQLSGGIISHSQFTAELNHTTL